MKERFLLCLGVPSFLVFVLSLPNFLLLAGCSTAASKTSQTPIISLAITQAPPTSLNVAGTAQISASVSGDPASAGVDWLAECGSAAVSGCGSFSPSHTASGGTTTYTAPLAVPSNNTVAVTAVSATDQSKSAAAMVTILSTVSGVTITQPPPLSIPSGAQMTLILAGTNFTGPISVVAAVAGDPSNSGVNWKVTCGTVSCNPPAALTSSPQGAASFTVPGPVSTPPVYPGTTVTLTAISIANPNLNASTSFTVSSPPAVTITQAPPSTLQTNATTTLVATVANDPTNAGVDWSVSCAQSPCGSFSPGNTNTAQSASGTPITFIAPPSPPPAGVANPVGGITITATAALTESGLTPATATANITILPQVTVAISPQNVQYLLINQSATFSASVSNDPSNAGADWSVTCSAGAGNCGAFSPTHTASGVTTTYTAPAAVPGGGTVTIVAASTASPSQTARTNIPIDSGTPPDSLLNGNFVMLLSGNSSSGPFALGGLLNATGDGNISGYYFDSVGRQAGQVSILPSTYSLGPDGRGQIQLGTTGNFGSGGSGTLTLSVVFVTPQHALLSETDSFGDAAGTLDLQNQNVSAFSGFSGTYSLQLSAPTPAGLNDFIGSALTISSGSYSYTTDQSNQGQITSVPLATVTQALPVSAGAEFLPGTYTFTSLNLGLGTVFTAFDVWAIDANHFVVTDWRDTPGLFGYMTAQPSTPTISGTYAFTEAGATEAGLPQAAGGIVTCGSGGMLDIVPLGGAPLTNQQANATCTAPVNGRALISISAASGASTGGISQFAAYPTADQKLYLIELDGGASGTSGPSGAGVALPQTLSAPISASALQGAYATQFAASTTPGSQVFVGQILSDGVSTLNGTIDVNSFNATASVGTPSVGAALSGSFTTAADGRFPLMLAISPASGQAPPQVTSLNPVCYIVDANTCLLLGLDAAAPGIGILQIQNTGL
jgi:hypothetical protein